MVNICIFDAYGTLFDVTSATRIVANEEEYSSFPNHSVKVSNSWRIKQLEYSWLRNIMHEYIDFWQITKDALDFALEENQIKNEKLRQRLLDVYWNLSAYPEAHDVLTTLKANNIQTGILSNGSNQMLNSAVVSANLENYLDKINLIDISKNGLYINNYLNENSQILFSLFNINQIEYIDDRRYNLVLSNGRIVMLPKVIDSKLINFIINNINLIDKSTNYQQFLDLRNFHNKTIRLK